MKKLIFFLMVLTFGCGCATTKYLYEPEGQTPTLLIGRIMLSTKNIPPGLELQDTYLKGIEVHIENKQTGEFTKLYSRGKDGSFSMLNPDAGGYSIEKFMLITYTSNYRWRVELDLQGYEFSIETGKVNNLGFIKWVADYNSKEQSVDIVDHQNMMSWFKSRYPESDWNSEEWVVVTIG